MLHPVSAFLRKVSKIPERSSLRARVTSPSPSFFSFFIFFSLKGECREGIFLFLFFSFLDLCNEADECPVLCWNQNDSLICGENSKLVNSKLTNSAFKFLIKPFPEISLRVFQKKLKDFQK